MGQIRDINLHAQGEARIAWVTQYMPLLAKLEAELSKEHALAGTKIAVSVHLEAKTARFCRLLQAAGATVCVTGSNPLSTRDDIAAALSYSGIETFAWYNATAEEYQNHIRQTLAFIPDIIVDDGGDFLDILHGELAHLSNNMLGGCEETTTGVSRMRARDRDGSLLFPMIAVNDADTKHLFDNRFGTGQSSWDAIMRLTNLIIAGKTVVVCGFGHCGQGIAEKARGLGAKVIITEIDPVKAIEAAMLGYEVMIMDAAAPLGDIFITATGCCDIIVKRHFMSMKDSALLCNAGHFDVEVDAASLRRIAVESKNMRKDVVGYTLTNGNTLMLLVEGRLVNVAGGDGHPAEIMDMSFALQTLCVLYLKQNGRALQNKVYDVPIEIDKRVADMKLHAMHITIDAQTPKQLLYLNSYNN